jgi:hypothetical protein
MKGHVTLDRAVAAALGAVALLGVANAANAQLYWDINGATAGATDDAGGVASGTWDGVAANWSTDATGASATTTFTAGTDAFFSAGTNATGASAIAVGAAQTVSNLGIEEGTIVLSGSAVAVNTGTVTINSGATLTIPSILNVTQTAGSGGLVLDGGTMKMTNPGNAGSFWDADGTIKLKAGGGTVNYTTSGTGAVSIYGSATLASATIVRDPSVPAGTPVTLTKTGPHEFRNQGLA